MKFIYFIILVPVLLFSCDNGKVIFQARKIDKSGVDEIIIYDNHKFKEVLSGKTVLEGEIKIKLDTLHLIEIPESMFISLERRKYYIIKGDKLCQFYEVYKVNTSEPELTVSTQIKIDSTESYFTIVKGFKK